MKRCWRREICDSTMPGGSPVMRQLRGRAPSHLPFEGSPGLLHDVVFKGSRLLLDQLEATTVAAFTASISVEK